jgi:hypothetical protein
MNPDLHGFLAPTNPTALGAFLAPAPRRERAAALCGGFVAEVHLLLECGAAHVDAVDTLMAALDVLDSQLEPAGRSRVTLHCEDAVAFLQSSAAAAGAQGGSSQRGALPCASGSAPGAAIPFDLVTALGGGPTYVGHGALLDAVRLRLSWSVSGAPRGESAVLSRA